MKEWLSVKEAAGLLKKDERTIQRNINKYKYKTIKSRLGGGKNGAVYKISFYSLGVEIVDKHFRIESKKAKREIDFIEYTDREMEIAIERKNIIEGFEDFWVEMVKIKGAEKKKAIIEYLKSLNGSIKNISVSTFYLWSGKYKDQGLKGLFPKYKERNLKQPNFSKAIKKYAYSYFFNQNKPSARSVYILLGVEAKKRDWDMPSYPTFYKFLKSFPKDVWIKQREGEKAFYDKVLPYIERNSSSLSSMEIIVGDHHQVDVAVKGYDGKVFFPWLTAWMDQRSRKIVGWWISKQPNSSTILYSLRRVIDEYGVCERVYIDNGKDYRAKTFTGKQQRFHMEIKADTEGIFSLLGIKTTWAIPYNARAKAIERFFRTFTQYFSKFQKGYRGSNVQQRPEKLKMEIKKDEIMEFDEIIPRIEKSLEFYNSELNHSGLNNASPDDVFYENLKGKVEVSNMVKRLLFMKVEGFRQVRQNGIRIFDSYYRSERLFDYFGKKVIVRYDPKDLTKIYVYDERNHYIGEVERFLKADNFYMNEELYKRYRQVVRSAKDKVKNIDKLWRVQNLSFDEWMRIDSKERNMEVVQMKMVAGMERPIKAVEVDDELSDIGKEFLDNLASSRKEKIVNEEDDIFKYL
jgi:transposase/transposase InsO family protein/RNAse (barnase) inhibitor barstar